MKFVLIAFVTVCSCLTLACSSKPTPDDLKSALGRFVAQRGNDRFFSVNAAELITGEWSGEQYTAKIKLGLSIRESHQYMKGLNVLNLVGLLKKGQATSHTVKANLQKNEHGWDVVDVE